MADYAATWIDDEAQRDGVTVERNIMPNNNPRNKFMRLERNTITITFVTMRDYIIDTDSTIKFGIVMGCAYTRGGVYA